MTEADTRIILERISRDALIVALDDIAYMHRARAKKINVSEGALDNYLDALLNIVCDKEVIDILAQKGITGCRKAQFYEFVLSKKFVFLKQVRDKFHL